MHGFETIVSGKRKRGDDNTAAILLQRVP